MGLLFHKDKSINSCIFCFFGGELINILLKKITSYVRGTVMKCEHPYKGSSVHGSFHNEHCHSRLAVFAISLIQEKYDKNYYLIWNMWLTSWISAEEIAMLRLPSLPNCSFSPIVWRYIVFWLILEKEKLSEKSNTRKWKSWQLSVTATFNRAHATGAVLLKL